MVGLWIHKNKNACGKCGGWGCAYTHQRTCCQPQWLEQQKQTHLGRRHTNTKTPAAKGTEWGRGDVDYPPYPLPHPFTPIGRDREGMGPRTVAIVARATICITYKVDSVYVCCCCLLFKFSLRHWITRSIEIMNRTTSVTASWVHAISHEGYTQLKQRMLSHSG